MSEENIKKVNINDLKIEELTLEEQEAFNYFNEDSSEVTFETNIDGDKLLETLGIKKENNFGVLQYKVLTLLNLIIKQQKEIENIKQYAEWHISHLTEDIKDYIDDDREGNADIIGELKEQREHWRDIIRIIKNEKTYIDYSEE